MTYRYRQAVIDGQRYEYTSRRDIAGVRVSFGGRLATIETIEFEALPLPGGGDGTKCVIATNDEKIESPTEEDWNVIDAS